MAVFESLAGRLLAAMPGINDPRFERAVILLCAHERDHAMGLRLDQPAPNLDLADVFARLELPVSDAVINRPVLSGGPVDRERGFVLHSPDWMSPEASLTVSPDAAITTTRDALVAMAEPLKGPKRSVLLLGYAGWGAGQLEDELGDNVWLIADPTPDLLFDNDYANRWNRALTGVGVDPALLSAQAGRA